MLRYCEVGYKVIGFDIDQTKLMRFVLEIHISSIFHRASIKNATRVALIRQLISRVRGKWTRSFFAFQLRSTNIANLTLALS